MNTLIGNLPRHLYVWVDTEYTHKEPCGFKRAVWFGLVSHPGRLFGCNVMFEDGAVYRNVPVHGIAFEEGPGLNVLDGWDARDSQIWDCYGYQFAVLEYTYLSGLECLAKIDGDQKSLGTYLFTVAPIGDGFSAVPEQAKEFMFIKLDNGRLTVQPTDRVIFRERSFTTGEMEFPKCYKRQTETWSCE